MYRMIIVCTTCNMYEVLYARAVYVYTCSTSQKNSFCKHLPCACKVQCDYDGYMYINVHNYIYIYGTVSAKMSPFYNIIRL